MGAVALHMQDGIADDDGRKARAAPVGLGRDGDVARGDGTAVAAGLVFAARCAQQQIPEAGRPGDGVDGAGCDEVFHRVVVLQGAGLAEVLEVPAARKVEGLRAVACARQDHALLVEGHHGRIVAVGERVPVLARGIGRVGLIVVVRKGRAAADADEAVIACLLPVDVVFRGAFHGCPGDVRAVAHHPVGGMFAVTAARLRGQRLLAVGVHGHDLVPQRVAEPRVIVVVAAHERTVGGLGSGQAAVEGYGFQSPAIAMAADGIVGKGSFRVTVRTADELVQRIGRVSQIDGIPHLGGADLQQMPGLVGRGQAGEGPCLPVEAVDVGDAQGMTGKDEHEVLLRQSIEAEGQEHGLIL